MIHAWSICILFSIIGTSKLTFGLFGIMEILLTWGPLGTKDKIFHAHVSRVNILANQFLYSSIIGMQLLHDAHNSTSLDKPSKMKLHILE